MKQESTMFESPTVDVFCQSNPQMAGTAPFQSTSAAPSSVAPHHHHAKPPVSTDVDGAAGKAANKYVGGVNFKIGIVMQRTSGKHKYRNIRAIATRASSCDIGEFVFLNETEDIQPQLPEFLRSHRSLASRGKKVRIDDATTDVKVSYGDEGYERMLQRPDIHGIYVVVPPGSEQTYILKALDAKKHVLVKDTVSTYLGEFMEQMEHAKKSDKFIQFSTMFIHQYRVQRFMDRVVREEYFGRIHSIQASLLLNYQDVRKVGVTLPLNSQTGCIRALGRYCILFSALTFSRVGSTAVSAQVHTYEKGQNGELTHATCTIRFTKVSERVGWDSYIVCMRPQVLFCVLM
mmetsp:Transcript_5919/g.17752  ORF Transcript_5919/g.17752 Transcript_5919/m.17752 type:complete len:346 (+) Transcript_5919:83-1120(+)